MPPGNLIMWMFTQQIFVPIASILKYRYPIRNYYENRTFIGNSTRYLLNMAQRWIQISRSTNNLFSSTEEVRSEQTSIVCGVKILIP